MPVPSNTFMVCMAKAFLFVKAEMFTDIDFWILWRYTRHMASVTNLELQFTNFNVRKKYLQRNL